MQPTPDINVPLAALQTANRMRHVAAYLAVNKKDAIWKQLAKLLEAEAQDIIQDNIQKLKGC